MKLSAALAVSVLLWIVACERVSEPEPAPQPTHVAVLNTVAGVVEGPGALADVFHVELGMGGEILVADHTTHRIMVFDEDGRFLRTIGRAGAGPGEFRHLGRIGWTGDTLWTLDVFGNRVHLWDANLEYVRTVTPSLPAPPPGVGRILAGPLLADGSILGVPAVFDDHEGAPLLLLDETGSVRREVARVASMNRSAQIDLGTQPRSHVSVANPWPTFPLWVNEAEGSSVIVVERPAALEPESAEFRVRRIGLDGDTILDEAVHYRPFPLDRETVDEVFRGVAERVSRTRSLSVGRVEAAIRDELSPPEFYPPITRLVPGRDGTIWIRREALTRDSVDWQVLDRSAQEVVRLRLPVDFEVYGGELERFWGVSRDSLDVPFVEVYQIERIRD